MTNKTHNTKYPWSGNLSWNSRVEIHDEQDLLKKLRDSNLPLDEPIWDDEGCKESENSKIVALVSVVKGRFTTLIATPNGGLYRVNPVHFEVDWWSFLARNYYVVMGNAEDRKKLSKAARVDYSQIAGKLLSRKKSTFTTELTLDEIIQIATKPTN